MNDPKQSHLLISFGDKTVSIDLKKNSESKKTWILNEEKKMYHSEIIWTVHVALNNYSFLSCDTIKQSFCSMFPDSTLTSGIQLSSRKVSYAISHGLGPYFLKQITDLFQQESPFFTLMYDETVNEQQLKQLDLHIRFWNLKEDSISERYIGSELLGHARALDIFSSILAILKFCKIELKGLVMLGSVGPNVNKSVFQLIDKGIKSIREHGLIKHMQFACDS